MRSHHAFAAAIVSAAFLAGAAPAEAGIMLNALNCNGLQINALVHNVLTLNALAPAGSALDDLNGVAVEAVTLAQVDRGN